MQLTKITAIEYYAEMEDNKPVVKEREVDTILTAASSRGRNAIIKNNNIKFTKSESYDVFIDKNKARQVLTELAKSAVASKQEVESVVDFLVFCLNRGCVFDKLDKALSVF